MRLSLRRWLGIDLVDFLIQAGVTFSLMGFVAISGGPTEVMPLVLASSLVVLGIRRHPALKKRGNEISGEIPATRIMELEDRVGDIDLLQERVVELEERLDFAERLLARQPEPEREPGRLPG
jgi:hypothetical protein